MARKDRHLRLSLVRRHWHWRQQQPGEPCRRESWHGELRFGCPPLRHPHPRPFVSFHEGH